MSPDDPDFDPPFADEELPPEAAGTEPVEGVQPYVVVYTCWRCDRTEVPDAGRCPFCLARLTDDEAQPARPAAGDSFTPILVGYVLILAVSVVWGWVLLAGAARLAPDDVLRGQAWLEAVDTVIVLVVFAAVGRVGLRARPTGKLVAWAVAFPALAGLIVLGLAYQQLLRDGIGVHEASLPPELTPFLLLLVCVQSAVVEELFFRYLALGRLNRVVGVHTAVWVTAVMFAMAHIYNPLGIPYLFVVGVALGYARVRGGLALAVVLHFLHNLAVILTGGA